MSTRISHDFLRNTNECKSFPLLLGGGYIPTYIKHKEGQMKLSIAATWMSPKYSSTLSFLKVTWQIYVSLRISPNKSPKLLKGDCISLAKIINIYKYIYIYTIHIYIYMYTYSDITYTFSVIEILYVIIYVYMCIHVYVL